MAHAKWLSIGRVGRTHGLAGDFFVPGREDAVPDSVKRIGLGDDPETAAQHVVTARWFRNGRAGIRLASFTTPEAVHGISGRTIWVERAHLPIEDGAEYFWADLIGKRLVDVGGVTLGTVVEVVNYGASDILEILGENGRRLAVPMVKQYLDLSFTAAAAELRLVVAAEVFADAWEDRNA